MVARSNYIWQPKVFHQNMFHGSWFMDRANMVHCISITKFWSPWREVTQNTSQSRPLQIKPFSPRANNIWSMHNPTQQAKDDIGRDTKETRILRTARRKNFPFPVEISRSVQYCWVYINIRIEQIHINQQKSATWRRRDIIALYNLACSMQRVKVMLLGPRTSGSSMTYNL